MGDNRVQLLGGILVLVSSTRHADTDSLRYVLDSLGPQELVQRGVDTDIPVKSKSKEGTDDRKEGERIIIIIKRMQSGVSRSFSILT